MCQLLGMNCNAPQDIMFSFTGFATRAEEHKDGFGIAFFEGAGVRLMVDAQSARHSPIAEMVRRYVMFQTTQFMVTGAAEFPKATEPNMHTEILMKARFFQILDATITIFGVSSKSWTQPNIWVNRDLMLAVFLG